MDSALVSTILIVLAAVLAPLAVVASWADEVIARLDLDSFSDDLPAVGAADGLTRTG